MQEEILYGSKPTTPCTKRKFMTPSKTPTKVRKVSPIFFCYCKFLYDICWFQPKACTHETILSCTRVGCDLSYILKLCTTWKKVALCFRVRNSILGIQTTSQGSFLMVTKNNILYYDL